MTTTSSTASADQSRHAIVDAAGCLRAGPYSLAVQTGDIVFTSGQIGLDPDKRALVEGGFEAETKQVFRNLKALLDAAGLTFADVVKCNVFLTDVSDFVLLNDIYASYFPEPFPARTTIGVAALPLGAKVEIEMILRRP